VRRWTWYLAAGGAGAAVAGAALTGPAAAAAAAQTWPAFVLVGGLLLIGLVAAGDGLFAAAGVRLAGVARSDWALFAGFGALVVVVTALLNLDTSVAFLTPVAVHTGRRRGEAAAVLVSACVLLSNAGSLLLPGSNLTNLIVLGHLHLAGGRFAARMALPWLAAWVLTAGVIAWGGRSALGGGKYQLALGGGEDRPAPGGGEGQPERRRAVIGMAAVTAAVAAVVALSDPAPEVLAIGVAAVGVRLVQRRLAPGQVWDVLGVPVLVGLFGFAVGMGALGRSWPTLSRSLAHLDPWATAAVGAAATVVVNNLPAAALLSARAPAHPFALLIGLNVGPNLFVSGSLAWVLWYGAARTAGAKPDVRRTVRLGAASAPFALAAAVAVLVLVGART
jgi:arsenical pump membrane protein